MISALAVDVLTENMHALSNYIGDEHNYSLRNQSLIKGKS